MPSSVRAVLLHHDFPSHLRMNRTKIRICPRLVKCVGELLVRIPHLGLEHTVRADHRVGNVISVGPDDRRSDRNRQRLRPKLKLSIFTSTLAAEGWSFAVTLGVAASSSIAIMTVVANPTIHTFFAVIVLFPFSSFVFLVDLH